MMTDEDDVTEEEDVEDEDDFGDSQQPGSVPIVGISALPPMKDQQHA